MEAEIKPFVLSLSKHERLTDSPFDKYVLREPFVLRQSQDFLRSLGINGRGG